MCQVYLYWMNVIGWNRWLFSAVFIFLASTSVHLHVILKFNTEMYNIFIPFSINYAPIFTAKLIKKFSTPIFISLSPFSPCVCFLFLFLNSIYLHCNFIISLENEILSTQNVYYYLLFMVNLCDKIGAKKLMEYQLSS